MKALQVAILIQLSNLTNRYNFPNACSEIIYTKSAIFEKLSHRLQNQDDEFDPKMVDIPVL